LEFELLVHQIVEDLTDFAELLVEGGAVELEGIVHDATIIQSHNF
jgi:hypothetical protein